MSEAFDIIQRNVLIEDLKNILSQDKLHLIRILFYMKITAKCVNCKSRFFSMDTGAPQGDCASASEFNFYPAKSLEMTVANSTRSIEQGVLYVDGWCASLALLTKNLL